MCSAYRATLVVQLIGLMYLSNPFGIRVTIDQNKQLSPSSKGTGSTSKRCGYTYTSKHLFCTVNVIKESFQFQLTENTGPKPVPIADK